METAVGIVVLVLFVALLWWGVRARNSYHERHDKPQTGSGGGSKPPKHTD